MKHKIIILFAALLVLPAEAQNLHVLENPFTKEFVNRNLSKSKPRIGIARSDLTKLLSKVKNDPLTHNVYEAIKKDAMAILEQPLLKRELEGRRLLRVSREMLYRMNCLGMVYLVEREPAILDRIAKEIEAVSKFQDWNPTHYLDVAEMALAVSIGLDWTLGDLKPTTIELGENALLEKAIGSSFNEKYKRRFFGTNNWNQVCNGGLIASAITIAHREPELAAKVLSRSMKGIPIALEKYMPDGVYPEGSTYWTYGTSFTVATIEMLKSAFGSDFGMSEHSGLIKSADFKLQMNAPSGMYYNFADCGTNRKENGDMVLAWFAKHTGNTAYLEKERFMRPTTEMGKLNRLCGLGLIYLSQVALQSSIPTPNYWKGNGENPLIVFRDVNDFYFGAKGGKATTSHGNMDAGSFIFEYKGIRWVTDPGNQNYHALEKEGFGLWDSKQNGERWLLLTKNNFGHSTLSVNDENFKVNGEAHLVSFEEGEKPKGVFDLSPVYFNNIKKVVRTFTKEKGSSVKIKDHIVASNNTKFVTWQLMTQAEVELTKRGAILKQDGKSIIVTNESHPDFEFTITSFDPPPMRLDKHIENLKRLDLTIPISAFQNGETSIEVLLKGN